MQLRLDMSKTGRWLQIRDGDKDALAIYEKHYSCYRYADDRPRFQFIGPGEHIALMTADCQALFVWRMFQSNAGQAGINCAVFRNEGPHLSSSLILEAEAWALDRWGPTRAYTYINPRAIKSQNPGYCFKIAGWQPAGISKKRKLLILEKHLCQAAQLAAKLR